MDTKQINALPPDADAKALVPVDKTGEEQAKPYSDLTNSPEITAFLNEIADYATRHANSPEQWERRRKTIKLRKYILGDCYGIFDRDRGWVSGKAEGDGIYYDPQTGTFIDTLLAQLVKSKPKKVCTARNPDRVDKVEAARVAEKLLALDDANDATPKRQQREWKWNLLAAGETFRITYFNQHKSGAGVNEEVYEQASIPGGESAHFCVLCDSTSISDTGECAVCGNPQVDSFETLETTVTVKKGTKYRQIGDVDYDIPDALEMTVIGDGDAISDGLIVLRDRMIPRCVLEDALGEDLPDADAPDYLRFKMPDEEDDDSGDMPRGLKKLHYQELWIAPAVYASYKLPQDTEIKGGETVPKGTSLKEAFPEGLYFSRVNKKVCNLYPQAAAETLSHCVNAVGEGFHGQGEWDLNELQDQLTEAKSMKMNSMLLDSTSPLLFRSGYVDADNLENKFGLIVPVNQDYPRDMHLSELMSRVPSAGLPSEAYELGNELKGQMQQRIGAFSTQSDAPDIRAMGTATGIAAITEQTLGRRGPALQLYAQMDVDQAYQKLELRQKYWCKGMYEPIVSDLGEDAVKWFMQCNIKQDISISVVPESWMPQTNAQKQANLQAFLGVAGEIIAAKGDPELMDDVLRKANDVFAGGLDLNDMKRESVEARLRLEKLRDVGQFVESTFGDMIYDEFGNIALEPIALAYSQTADMLKINHVPVEANDIFAEIPLDVMFDVHPEFGEHYTDWLKSAEGRAASAFVRTLVRQLADYHLQADFYRQMKISQYSQLTQLPQLEAQMTADAAMAEAEGGASADAEMQSAAMQMDVAKAQSVQDLEHQAAQNELDLQKKAQEKEMDLNAAAIQQQMQPAAPAK